MLRRTWQAGVLKDEGNKKGECRDLPSTAVV